MLYRLEIENFWSIRDRQVIDLRVRSATDDPDGRLAPIWPGAGERAPKVVAVFGANASGKSNLLKAPAFLAWFLQHSFSAPRGSKLPFERFNASDTVHAPMRIVAHMGGLEDMSRSGEVGAPSCAYIYALTLGGHNNDRVLSESLHYRPNKSARKVRLFERHEGGHVEFGKAFKSSEYQHVLNKILRDDASVISTLSQLNHNFSNFIINRSKETRTNILSEKSDIDDQSIIGLYGQSPTLIEKINQDVQRVDLGVRSMRVEASPQGPRAMFEHNGLTFPMLYEHQSHGTRQFIKFYPTLVAVLEHGGIAILDEIDAAIHPMIIPEIVRWFHDPARNLHNAQLWMTCHNASVLEALSKDEVFFCDKDTQGRTEIYGLRDIAGVKRSDNFYKKYLGGSFGAVPQIG